MKHLFVPYEIALLAKQQGFDGECLSFYSITSKSHIMCKALDLGVFCTNKETSLIAAPIYQQLVDWFREEHDVYINVVKEPIGSDEWEYSYEINYLPVDKKEAKRRCPEFIYISSFSCTGSTYCGAWRSYYEAFNEALTKAFKLI